MPAVLLRVCVGRRSAARRAWLVAWLRVCVGVTEACLIIPLSAFGKADANSTILASPLSLRGVLDGVRIPYCVLVFMGGIEVFASPGRRAVQRR